MKQIPLRGKFGRGKFALVDADDYAALADHLWYVREQWGHVYTAGGIQMHRMVMSAPTGTPVDHRDRNPLNNQKTNLRLATAEKNNWNIGPKNGKRFKGVHWAGNGQYSVYIRNVYLGKFPSAEYAALVFNDVAKQIYGDFAYQNEVD